MLEGIWRAIPAWVYPVIRPLLWRLEPEWAHDLTLRLLGWWAGWLPPPHAKSPAPDALYISRWKRTCPHRVGLAAGLDKNGEQLGAWMQLGFGFIEVGTVTPKPQPGNPPPRLFRFPQEAALVNRMGFNNQGMEALVERVAACPFRTVPIGINIGKNKDTPLDQAGEDYRIGYQAVYPLADYVTVNISSPNTPGLRTLQNPDPLLRLLESLKAIQQSYHTQSQRYVPLLIKIAPDLSLSELEILCGVIRQTELDGIVATNTTVSRPLHWTGKEAGGLSGAPLFAQSLRVVREVAALLGGSVPIIGAGGIDSPEKAVAMREAGADLVQIYTGFVYQGPTLIARLRAALA